MTVSESLGDPNHSPVQPSTPGDDTIIQLTLELPPLRMAHFRSPDNTPSTRTGPPRSLSYSYSLPSPSRRNSKFENGNVVSADTTDDTGFSPRSTFRGVLEHGTPDIDRKGKKRERGSEDRDSWNPMRWFYESPKEEEAPGFEFGPRTKDDKAKGEPGEETLSHDKGTPTREDSTPTSRKSVLRRAFSVPHTPEESKIGRVKWSRLRSLIPNMVHHDTPVTPGPSVAHSVNITDELITGGLSTLMLRLWFERDEKGQRRVPVLLHRLRIRVSDSLHPMHDQKSVFRIECEYANGAARWVVYRQLRDFISLHAHYAVANVYNRSVQVDKMPEFPRTSALLDHYIIVVASDEATQAFLISSF
jgi:phospholipase D1/2